MRWHILGAGAIGSLFAERFIDAGIACCLLLRDESQRRLFARRGNRLLIQRPPQARALTLDAETAQSADTPITHLLVTTKAYDSQRAVAALQPRLAPAAQIVLLQNGLGHQQALAALLAPRQVWAAITTCGAHRNAPFEVTPAGAGTTTLGLIGDSASRRHTLPEGWEGLGADILIHDDITRALWQKLAINAAINPLTALHACRNGELLSPPRRQQLSALCREIEQIASACGQALFERPLLEAVTAVADATGSNFSSMLQDIRANRPTEIAQITGFLCAQAEQNGLQAPLNQALLQQIQRQTRNLDE